MTASCLYDVVVTHRRTQPHHTLRLRIGMLLLDLDALPDQARRLRLFRLGRTGLVSFDPRDHGDGPSGGLRDGVERRLAAAGIAWIPSRIAILCMPRILGHAFNPLSVFICEDATGRIGALLYAVHNTFGERHDYVQRIDNEGDLAGHVQTKRFHVSPLLPMALSYRFRMTPPGARMTLGIDAVGPEGAVLHASMAGSRQELSDPALLRLVLRLPLQGMKVLVLIHWHAFRTWRKGAPLHRHPGACDPAPTTKLSST